MRLSISVNFDILFKNSPIIFCKTLLIPKNYLLSRSVFCDPSRVLTLISSTKDKSSSRVMLSISMYVGNSLVSLAATLKDLCSAGGVLSMPKKCFVVFTPPNLPFKVFGAKKLAYLFC